MKEILGMKIIALAAVVVLAGAAMLTGKKSAIPGIHEETLDLQKGQKMRYTLSIPAGYGEKPVPLVLALHYGGQVTPYYGKGVLAYLVEPALRELGPIVVSPDCPGRGWDNPTVEAAVLALLDYVKKNYSIDPQRVVVTGFSMGGIGTWYLAARHPELFSAAIPIAGASDSGTIEKIGDIPLYVIHSKADQVLPIASTEKIVNKLRDRGRPVEFVILNGVDHYDTSGFTEALKGAVPWLKKIWSQAD